MSPQGWRALGWALLRLLVAAVGAGLLIAVDMVLMLIFLTYYLDLGHGPTR